MIQIELNGDSVEVPAGETVAGLLDRLELSPQAVAVEHNGEILKRSGYASTLVESGDRLELVHFVQGG